jgi:hypothetical protein
MKRRAALSLLLAGVLSLTGCHEAPVASPAIDRPLVERKVTQLTGRVGAPIRIPLDARVMLAGTPGVFVLSNHQARFRMVKAGKRYGNKIEIISGLQGDEALVMPPYDGVYDGSPVKPASE